MDDFEVLEGLGAVEEGGGDRVAGGFFGEENCGRGDEAVGFVGDDVSDLAAGEDGEGFGGGGREVEAGGVDDAGEALVGTAADAGLAGPIRDGGAEPPRGEDGGGFVGNEGGGGLAEEDVLRALLVAGSLGGGVGVELGVPGGEDGEEAEGEEGRGREAGGDGGEGGRGPRRQPSRRMARATTLAAIAAARSLDFRVSIFDFRLGMRRVRRTRVRMMRGSKRVTQRAAPQRRPQAMAHGRVRVRRRVISAATPAVRRARVSDW